MENMMIREAARTARVKLWEIAYAMGITDSTLSRRLRRELPEEEQQKILALIQRIKEGEAS